MRRRQYTPGDTVQCTLCRRALTVTADLRVPQHGQCPSSGLTLQGEHDFKEPPPDAVAQTRKARAILDKALKGDSGLTHREWEDVADNADNIIERASHIASYARGHHA